jgi:hypothetical protein
VSSPPTDKKEGVQETSVLLGECHRDTKGSLKTVNRLLKVIEQLLFEGRIRPNNIEVVEGGLNSIPDGLQKLKKGVSAKKLIVKVD